MDPLLFLSSITILLLAGIVSVPISRRIKLPLMLVLFVVGIALGSVLLQGRPLIQLSGTFLSVFSIVAVMLVIFEATSKLKRDHLTLISKEAIMLFFVGLLLNFVIISSIAKYLYGFQWFSAIVFSCLISCIEYAAIYPRHHIPNSRVTQFLKDESIISSVFVVFTPFLILSFMQYVHIPFRTNVLVEVLPFIVTAFGGVGIGIILSLIVYNALHNKTVQKYASFVLAAAVVAAYVLAQRIQGNGFIAVATMGLIFAQVFFRQKNTIKSEIIKLDSVLELFLFLLVAVVVSIPFTWEFFRLSLGLFVAYVLVRCLAVMTTLRKYSFVEQLEIGFFVPKGMVTVSVAFALLNYTFFGIVLLVQVLLAFFVYSLVFDTILDKLGFYRNR